MALPRFFQLIGSDRMLSVDEVARAVGPHPHIEPVWQVYARQFQSFTGASLDPLFHRLNHPARRQGNVCLEPDTSVVVVGTGPSLAAQADVLKGLRQRVRIFTSPRGAEALLARGIPPDLVLVEHQTALDAHHSARHTGDAALSTLPFCPLVAADWRTPAALLAGVPQTSLFVPASLPTWGLWPATAVAMAIEAGASRVALLGVDLGQGAEPDPVHAPLASLLALLARLSPIVALDCGGVTKRGWLKASLEEAARREVHGPCEVRLHPTPRIDERRRTARTALSALAPIVNRARVLMDRASSARAGDRRISAADLRGDCAEMMSWRDDLQVRTLLQEALGLSFAPRLWRIGIDPELGRAAWRPLLLATHELVRQAEALGGAIVLPAETTPRIAARGAA